MTKYDLKLALRDCILMTSLDRIKRGDAKAAKYTADFYAIERIAKLLVSTSQTVERYMTKEMLLKIMKSMVTNNCVVMRSRTGRSLALIVNNEAVKKMIC